MRKTRQGEGQELREIISTCVVILSLKCQSHTLSFIYERFEESTHSILESVGRVSVSLCLEKKPLCNHTGTVLQHFVLPGIARGNNMCNCLVAVMSTQAITLLAHSKVNTSDCEERVGAQEMQVLASAITR